MMRSSGIATGPAPAPDPGPAGGTALAPAPSPATGSHRAPRRLRWARLLTMAAAWVVIVAIGRSVFPFSSRAQTAPGPAAVDAKSLGILVGRDYILHITASPDGPRYTVSTLSGQVLRTDLDSSELAKAFPALDPSALQAAPGRTGAPLMQADTGERPRD